MGDRVTELPAQLAKIVATAVAEIGHAEMPKGSNRGPRIDVYRPEWKRDDLLHADKRLGKLAKGDPWCSWYVTWCWNMALAKHPLGRPIGGCYALATRAMELGLWIPLSGKQDTDMLFAAYPGCAFVLLDKPIKEGQSDGHTGIITGVSEDGATVSTVEGNSGDQVRAGKRELSDPKMRGIVTPLGLDHVTGDWPRGLKSNADLAALGTR
jgi:hypothetical protein